MKMKQIATFLLACIIFFMLSVPALAAGENIMSGSADKRYVPDALLTKAQLASVLYDIAGAPDVRDLTEPFADVPGFHPSRNAIIWAYNSGLMQGHSTHFFFPETPVYRGQLVSILHLFAGSPQVSSTPGFRDAALIPPMYRKAAVWAETNGIISDFCGGCFGSALPVTHAQMAAIAENYSRITSGSEQKEPTRELTAATFNISHCLDYRTDKTDYDTFAKYLEALDADIIAMNEVRGKGLIAGYDAQAAILAEKLGYYYYFAKSIDLGSVASYGNAVLTRFRIKSCETIRIPGPGLLNFKIDHEPRCLLKITLADPELTVLVSHFGLDIDEQQNAVKTAVSNISDKRCILMGDLNVTPDEAVLDPIRARLNDTVSPEQELFTYPADAPGKRIDYIFVSPDISVDSVYVPSDGVSDHLPIVAQLRLPEDGQ